MATIKNKLISILFSNGLYFWFILLITATLSTTFYVRVSQSIYRVGFPLDDAWIHQTYARNLAEYGQMVYIPGQLSAGSTAPLWSGLLALGHYVGLSPQLWTYLLGGFCLFGLAMIGIRAFLILYPGGQVWAIFMGILLLFEWHLVWAAVSGMETLLFSFFVMLVLTWLISDWQINWILLGFIIGVSIWIRPDGLTLIGPALFVTIFMKDKPRIRIRNLVCLMFGFALIFIPYLMFNQILADSIWPNTFYAKQLEYEILQSLPLWKRYLHQLQLPLVGVGLILLPGFALITNSAIRKNQWNVLAGVFWVLGYLFLYALRLPVTYQHGRYVMPVMPIYFVWSVAGMATFLQLKAKEPFRRIVSRLWVISLFIVLFLFWGIGAKTYGIDVAVIESEMVETAKWLDEHTNQLDLVAAHDIGALGYFCNCNLLDLAGLISPEVIPFIRDEKKLEYYLDMRGASFIVTFPGWYPDLVSKSEMIYSSNGEFSTAIGGENMSVFRWTNP